MEGGKDYLLRMPLRTIRGIERTGASDEPGRFSLQTSPFCYISLSFGKRNFEYVGIYAESKVQMGGIVQVSTKITPSRAGDDLGIHVEATGRWGVRQFSK